MDPIALALGAVVPGTICLVAFLALAWRKDDPSRKVWLAAPILLTLVYVGMHHWLLGKLSWPPAGAVNWLPMIALVFGVLMLADALVPRFISQQRANRWQTILKIGVEIRIVAAAFALWASVRTISADWTIEQWGRQAGMLVGAIVIAGLAAQFASIRPDVKMSDAERDRMRTGFFPILVLMLWVGSVSQLLVLGYSSLRLGQAIGFLAACLGGLMVASFFRPKLSLGQSGTFFVVALATTGLYHGVQYGTTEANPYVLAGIAMLGPVLWSVASIFLPRGMHRGWRGLLEIGVIVTPPTVALAIALLTGEPKDSSGY
jgi:hypothetical protein